MSEPRLLLVEDSSEDVLFFRRAVREAGLGCSLEVAADGQEAINRLQVGGEMALSHVILDLKLPRMSGLEILAWMRSRPDLRERPVIILTSSQVPSDIQKASELGIDAFLVKPVSFRELVDVVRVIADRWKFPTAAAPKPV
jgi:two-component system response regulator